MTTNTAFQELRQEMTQLYIAGNFSAALDIIEQNAFRFPDEVARTVFWRMCLLSRCGRPDDLLSVFQQGLNAGLWWHEGAFQDPDFDDVRDLPEFKRLVDESNLKCLEARAQIKPERTTLLPDETGKDLPLLIVLHGHSGDKDHNLDYWRVACERGWLVLSPQSTRALFTGSYTWDDAEQGIKDILYHVNEIMDAHRIDQSRILLGGFSQGSGMSIYAALSGKIPARGFIGIGTWWDDVDSLASLMKSAQSLRGYFVTGEKDHTLERAREIQEALKANSIQFAEEVHSNIGHEFSPDFASSFDKAIEFIFKE